MTLRDLLPWSDNVSRIQAKLTAAQERVNELTQKRSDLALDAALDDGTAKKQLDKIGGDLGEAERSVANLQMAMQQAQQKASEAEAERAVQAEQDRQQKIKELIDERAALVGNVEDSILSLERDLTALTALDNKIGQLVGGPILTGGPEQIGWYTNCSRVLNFSVLKDRLLYFAYPHLKTWLDIPVHGINPAYKGRSLREIEQEAVDIAVFDKQVQRPMLKHGMTEEELAKLPPNPSHPIAGFRGVFKSPLAVVEPQAPLAKAVRSIFGFTDDPKAIAEAEARKA